MRSSQKSKIVVIVTQGRVTSAYVSPELKGQFDIQVVDYDHPINKRHYKKNREKDATKVEIAEIEIQEHILVEQKIA